MSFIGINIEQRRMCVGHIRSVKLPPKKKGLSNLLTGGGFTLSASKHTIQSSNEPSKECFVHIGTTMSSWHELVSRHVFNELKQLYSNKTVSNVTLDFMETYHVINLQTQKQAAIKLFRLKQSLKNLTPKPERATDRPFDPNELSESQVRLKVSRLKTMTVKEKSQLTAHQLKQKIAYWEGIMAIHNQAGLRMSGPIRMDDHDVIMSFNQLIDVNPTRYDPFLGKLMKTLDAIEKEYKLRFWDHGRFGEYNYARLEGKDNKFFLYDADLIFSKDSFNLLGRRIAQNAIDPKTSKPIPTRLIFPNRPQVSLMAIVLGDAMRLIAHGIRNITGRG